MVDRGKIAKTNRRKGHDYERKIAAELRTMGVECGTSRRHSRAHDDAKVDIFMLNHDAPPLNIQCKNNNVFHSPVKVLGEMPKDENYNLLFQKVKGTGEYVTMEKRDFYEIMNILLTEKIWRRKP